MPLLILDAGRQATEIARAQEAERAMRCWRRAWLRVYGECIALFVVGYVLYGVSWGLSTPRQVELVLALSVLVSYLLPLLRLLLFFVRNAEHF